MDNTKPEKYEPVTHIFNNETGKACGLPGEGEFRYRVFVCSACGNRPSTEFRRP